MFTIIIFGIKPIDVHAEPLDKKATANTIADICVDNYETYGVLPSVAIGQAYLESGLGEKCRPYNLWGINNGKASYDSLEEGVHAYLKCINNGRYDDALFNKDYKSSLQHIQNGGYSVNKKYASTVCSIIESNNLDEYDEPIQNAEEE